MTIATRNHLRPPSAQNQYAHTGIFVVLNFLSDHQASALRRTRNETRLLRLIAAAGLNLELIERNARRRGIEAIAGLASVARKSNAWCDTLILKPAAGLFKIEDHSTCHDAYDTAPHLLDRVLNSTMAIGCQQLHEF